MDSMTDPPTKPAPGLWSPSELTPNTIERLLVDQGKRTSQLSNDVADLTSSMAMVEARLVRVYEGHDARLVVVEQAYDRIGARLSEVATRGDVADLRLAILSGRNSSLDEDMDLHKTIGTLRERVAGLEGDRKDRDVKGGAIGGGAGALITILLAVVAWLLGIELPL